MKRKPTKGEHPADEVMFVYNESMRRHLAEEENSKTDR